MQLWPLLYLPVRNLRAPGCLCVHSYSRIYCCLSVTYHASQQFSFEHVRKYDSQKFYAGSCRYLSSSTFLGHLCSGNKCSRHWLIYQVRLVSTVLSVICIERIAMFSLLGGFSVYQNLASSPACAKKGRAPGTHYTLFVHEFNLPKMWGLRAIFWFFRVMWCQSLDTI